uniref:Pheromone receptor Rcb2 B44 n=1 Tax=Coprinopsis cinerea TaxID=5346 RepID=Q6TMD0_COPCI|nr:pheromone receptor Rcb2 B44 [Coprinopsis cinerea]
MTLDPTYPLFPIFAFVGCILCLIPLPWHLQAWNSGTCFFMAWTALACLNQFVNSVVWSGNAINHAPIWCEISIRILMGASVGIPASSMCIVRRLYAIARSQKVAITRAEKRRAVIMDSLICVLLPIVYVALQVVVQGHRFDIFEDIGCYPIIYNTLLSYFISFAPPLAIGLVSAVYSLSLYEFNRRRLQFNAFLNSGTSLTSGRYLRLMALATTEMMLTTPLSIFIIYLNATVSPIEPWISWADTHYDYWRVGQYPRVLWQLNHLLVVSMELTRWLAPFSAIVFFIFFGFAEEAKRHYKAFFAPVTKMFRRFFPASPILPSLSSKKALPSPAATERSFQPLKSAATTATILPLHSATETVVSTESFNKTLYGFEHDPNYVIDIKAPAPAYNLQDTLSPTSTERTLHSDITFSTNHTSRRFTM